MAKRVLVWDLPTRLFHWLLAAAFAAAWLSSGDARYLDIHLFAGELLLALLLFRLVWGLRGGRYARFAQFACRPRTALAYLADLRRGRARRFLGHNPAGAWAVFALLGLNLAVALTGLLVIGGQKGAGPLAGWLSISAGLALRPWHEYLAWAALGLVGLHLLGVIVESRAHRENLAAAMVTGHKPAGDGAPEGRPRGHLAAAMVLAAAAFGLWFFQGALTATPKRPYRPFVGPQLAQSPMWRSECGACHLAYHPSLLPARSWRALLAGQHDHFGEDLYLEPATVQALERFAVAHAAGQGRTEAAWRIAHGSTGTTPLRITDTPYWRRTHRDIPDAAWKRVRGRGNCAACHLDAAAGTFQPAAMHIPEPPNR